MVCVLKAAPNRGRRPLSQQRVRVLGEEVGPLARQVFVAAKEVFILDQAAVTATLVAELGLLAVDYTDVIRHELRLGKLGEGANRRFLPWLHLLPYVAGTLPGPTWWSQPGHFI